MYIQILEAQSLASTKHRMHYLALDRDVTVVASQKHFVVDDCFLLLVLLPVVQLPDLYIREFHEHYDIGIDVSYDALGVVPGVSTDKHYCCKLMM